MFEKILQATIFGRKVFGWNGLIADFLAIYGLYRMIVGIIHLIKYFS